MMAGRSDQSGFTKIAVAEDRDEGGKSGVGSRVGKKDEDE